MSNKLIFFVTLFLCVGVFDIYAQQDKSLVNRAEDQSLYLEVNDGGVQRKMLQVKENQVGIGEVQLPFTGETKIKSGPTGYLRMENGTFYFQTNTLETFVVGTAAANQSTLRMYNGGVETTLLTAGGTWQIDGSPINIDPNSGGNNAIQFGTQAANQGRIRLLNGATTEIEMIAGGTVKLGSGNTELNVRNDSLGGSGTVFTGTYTPTYTTVGGCTSASHSRQMHYMRVGNKVHGWVHLDANCNTTGDKFEISIPFGGNFTDAGEAGGTCMVSNSANPSRGFLRADVGSARMGVDWKIDGAGWGGLRGVVCHFGFEVQ